ncbi:hypothetical protein F5Y03DRAFT_357319 [Xylaria venustula]|nr:hypothetical protein F5Y03DRAFT_357319 [Xylaria venustula]
MSVQGALSGFYWRGRDLHSQRRYLALRLRFRGEPYGYMIAHDIHDALKESRKRVHKLEKEAAKQRKKDRKSGRRNTAPEIVPESAIQRFTPPPPPPPPPRAQSRSRLQPDLRFQPVSRSRSGGSAPRNTTSKKAANEQGQAVNVNVYVNLNRGTDGTPSITASEPQEAESSKRKAKKKLSKIFTTTTKSPDKASSKAVALPEDPFGDPAPEPKRSKPKSKKERMKKKWKKKGTASLESLGSARDPFRDPEPMRLIEADDFRVESPENTEWPDASLHGRSRKLGRGRRGKGRDDKMRK